MDKETIDILYNQIIDNQRKSLYPIFDPDAHTREEFLLEKERVEREMKDRGRFLKLILRLKNN